MRRRKKSSLYIFRVHLRIIHVEAFLNVHFKLPELQRLRRQKGKYWVWLTKSWILIHFHSRFHLSWLIRPYRSVIGFGPAHKSIRPTNQTSWKDAAGGGEIIVKGVRWCDQVYTVYQKTGCIFRMLCPFCGNSTGIRGFVVYAK